MIPKEVEGVWDGQVYIQRIPSETYGMDIMKKKIYGTIADRKAMEQAIYKVLHTERYVNLIYDGAYGLESADLFGKPQSYVIPELQKRITETLLADDRVEAVTDFQFTQEKNTLVARFCVETIFGDLKGERGISVYV